MLYFNVKHTYFTSVRTQIQTLTLATTIDPNPMFNLRDNLIYGVKNVVNFIEYE
jgi:hypothetical protein